jgi:AbrB family looped-hinge helix DNA binding protein
MKATVSPRGRLTIPKSLRDRLGIRPGDVLDVDEEAGRLVARKAISPDPVDAAYGVVKSGLGSDSWLTELRGEPGAS